ncbi:MAG TPA: type II secretion system protein [Gemmatimonadaceae bacterium]
MRIGSARAGFTLVELIAATTIAAVVGSALMLTLRRQERFYRAAAEVLQVRAQLRDAADVLAADIRGTAVARYGFPLMTDSAMELFSTIGSSVACRAPVGRTIFLPPVVLAGAPGLTSLLASPDTGDVALIYAIPAGVPDSGRWMEFRISAFGSRSLASSCPPDTGFTSAADAAAGQPGYAVTLSDIPSPSVRKGAPIRFIRRARYSLYRSSDNNWYLGYRRCNAVGRSICGTIQPVSGPYLPYRGSGGTGAGLAFRYFDSTGEEVVDALLSPAVARIDVVLRGETAREVSFAGDARQRLRDSAIVSVSPRNRAR